jgi:signal transduction histidine kinase
MTNSKVNILMVDDEAANLLSLEATLEGLDQNLIRASSGKEALRQLLDKDFAVILLDVQMPEMSGLETATAIRERERSRHIPIVFLTGMVKTEEMMFRGYSAGAVDYLVKPIIPEVLRAKVEVFVELGLVRQRLQQEITERTRIAAELSDLNRELASKNITLEERTQALQETVSELESYSYSISHDMRAPLRAMTGYSEILLEECLEKLEPLHQSYLRKISSAAQRMDHLIGDVLSYSRVSQSKFEMQRIDVDKLIREIAEQYPGMQTGEAEIDIRGQLPEVWANEALLTQCISNLLGNAVKFVQPGMKPQLKIWGEPRGSDIRLWFEDNGIGIAGEDIKRIFEIFVKVHPDTEYLGTGIGLSIVRRATEKMGGTVGLESELGKGSKFWLQLRGVFPQG